MKQPGKVLLIAFAALLFFGFAYAEGDAIQEGGSAPNYSNSVISRALCIPNTTGDPYEGLTGGEEHCHWNMDYLDLRLGNVVATPAVTFDPAEAVAADGTIVVNSFTTMTVSGFTSFVQDCINGVTMDRVHAYDLYVNGNWVVDNYDILSGTVYELSCFGRDTLFDGYLDPVPPMQYQFITPGLNTVEVWVASQDNGTCGMMVEQFDVLVARPPVLTISGPSSQIVPFKQGETSKTFYMTWTISNVGTTRAMLKGIEPVGCDAGLSCSFPGFASGMAIDSGETFLVVEEIVASSPTATPSISSLSLNLNYTDEYEALDETAQPGQAVGFSRLWVEDQKFHVELYSGDQNYCIGKDGRLGGTGKGDVPNTRFDWSWGSIQLSPTANHHFNCDKRAEYETGFVYCDPTQFSIEIMKRLEEMRQAFDSGDSATAASLQSFQAYLIGDNYSMDFREDFDYHYTQVELLDTPDWYDSAETPWNSYMTTADRLIFAPSEITSGLYAVKIEPVYLHTDRTFFFGSEPVADITVKLTKIRDPYFQSPFYYLPFNGKVGYTRLDSDGRYERKDYGIGFQNEVINLVSSSAGNLLTTAPISGSKMVDIGFEQDFVSQNITNRGIVLSISKGIVSGNTGSINFSPSLATPVLARIDNTDARTDAYYYVLENQAVVDTSPATFMSLWSGIASGKLDASGNPIAGAMECRNFDNSSFYYRRHDGQPNNQASCGLEYIPSYGFTWGDGVSPENYGGSIFMQSIFYSPLASSSSIMTLHSACDNVLLFGPGTESTIPLNYKVLGNSLLDVFDLVEEEYICVSVEDNALEFWWNPQKLRSELLEDQADKIPEGWECAIEGEQLS